MLVSEVIDRTYSSWLYPAGVNRPPFDRLTAGIDASTLTITVDETIPNIPDHSAIEIDSELILLRSVSGATLTAQERGYLETDGATHSAGAKVFVEPTYTRKTIFNTLVGIIGLLNPAGLYARLFDTTQTVDWSVPIHTLPSGGQQVLAVLEQSTGSVIDYDPFEPGIDFQELPQFSPPKYRINRGAQGASLHVVYAADFTTPTAESDNLSTLAAPIPATLQPHLPMAVAGYILQGREIPQVQVEDIRRKLAAEGIQVGSAINVGEAMLNAFMRRYVAAERDRLQAQDLSGLEVTR